MDIFEYSDVHCPSRTLQQEEEEQAVPTAHLNFQPPVVILHRTFEDFISANPSWQASLLVIATCKASCALLNACCEGQQACASVILPGLDQAGNSLGPSVLNKKCKVHSIGPAHNTLLISCQYAVAAQQANSWAKAVLAAFPTQHVIIAGSTSAESYVGPGDPAQEALLYKLQTTRITGMGSRCATVPYLPTGNLVGGLPAALLSQCELRGKQAEVFLCISMLASLLPEAVEAFAAALMSTQNASEQPSALSTMLTSKHVVAAAKAQVLLKVPFSNIFT